MLISFTKECFVELSVRIEIENARNPVPSEKRRQFTECRIMMSDQRSEVKKPGLTPSVRATDPCSRLARGPCRPMPHCSADPQKTSSACQKKVQALKYCSF